MKPILFNTEMVKAILDGIKMQTRRPIKLNIKKDVESYSLNGAVFTIDSKFYFEHNLIENLSKYKVGDVLYVKEKCVDEYPNGFCFKEDYEEEEWNDKYLIKQYCNKLNARIFLKVTNVRVERLQDINEYDIFNEGFALVKMPIGNKIFINNWNSTAKDGYKWEDNPYVFVYEFESIIKED